MFFDHKKEEPGYRQLLIELARKQGDLFWISCNRDVTQEEIQTLEELREHLRNIKRQDGGWYEMSWWNIPWEQIEKKLKQDTELFSGLEIGGWEWQSELKYEENDNHGLLCLLCDGRKYGYSLDADIWRTERHSAYTEAQQKDLVNKFNQAFNKYQFWDAALSDGKVYSSLTDTLYDSKASYYLSMENFITRWWISDYYEKSLYTETTHHDRKVSSHNQHRRSIYDVARIHISNEGTLDMIRTSNYQPIASDENWNPFMESLQTKDPLVMCAKFLGQYQKVQRVPVELFCKNIEAGTQTYEQAMRQAQVFTCLARKMF